MTGGNMLNNSDELIFKEVTKKLTEQSESIKSIDNKATLTLTLIGVLLAGLVNSSWFIKLSRWWHFIIIFPLVIAAVLSLLALLVRQFKGMPDPENLIYKYKNESEEITRGQVILYYTGAYKNNLGIVRNKVIFLRLSSVVITISIVILMLTILFANTH